MKRVRYIDEGGLLKPGHVYEVLDEFQFYYKIGETWYEKGLFEDADIIQDIHQELARDHAEIRRLEAALKEVRAKNREMSDEIVSLKVERERLKLATELARRALEL